MRGRSIIAASAQGLGSVGALAFLFALWYSEIKIHDMRSCYLWDCRA